MNKYHISIILKAIVFVICFCITVDNVTANPLDEGGRVSVIINPTPTYSKRDTSVCQYSVVELNRLATATSPNSIIEFYVGNPSTSLTKITNTLIVTSTKDTVFYIHALNTLTNCASLFDSIKIHIYPLPAQPIFASTSNVCVGGTLALAVSNPEPNCSIVWFNKTTNGNAQVTSDGIVTGIKTGIETVTCIVTDTLTGCSVNKDMLINVMTGPAIAEITHLAPLCEGDPMHLEAKASGEQLFYQWYVNGKLIVGATSSTYDIASVRGSDQGVYTVRVTNECNTQGDSASTEVIVHWTGLLVVKWDDVLLVNNREDKFIAYQWYKNGVKLSGETKQFLDQKGGLDGLYRAEITRVDGTKFMTCDTLIVMKGSVSKIHIYPNPVVTTREITVKIDGYVSPSEVTKLELVNVLGQKYGNYQFTGNECKVTMGVPAGTYMIVVYRESGERVVEKIIVQSNP